MPKAPTWRRRKEAVRALPVRPSAPPRLSLKILALDKWGAVNRTNQRPVSRLVSPLATVDTGPNDMEDR